MFLLCQCAPKATRTLMPSPGIYPSPPLILLIKTLLMSWTSPPECFRELVKGPSSCTHERVRRSQSQRGQDTRTLTVSLSVGCTTPCSRQED